MIHSFEGAFTQRTVIKTKQRFQFEWVSKYAQHQFNFTEIISDSSQLIFLECGVRECYVREWGMKDRHQELSIRKEETFSDNTDETNLSVIMRDEEHLVILK